MSKKKKNTLSKIIGFIVVAFILWKIIGHVLQNQAVYAAPQELLSDVIQKHTGSKDWSRIEQLSFTKEFQLYGQNGRVEKARTERHKYSYTTPEKKEIHWVQQDTSYVLTNLENSIIQTVNNIKDSIVTEQQLYAKLNAAEFVITLPHSLKSINAFLEYEGIQEFQEKPCHTLKVKFKDSEDLWWMYFQEITLDWIGYWVKTSGHYSLIINEEMVIIDGFTFSKKRKSFRTDSLQNKTYLRASYDYSHFNIN